MYVRLRVTSLTGGLATTTANDNDKGKYLPFDGYGSLGTSIGKEFLEYFNYCFCFCWCIFNERTIGRAAVDLSLYKGRVFLSAGRVSLESDEEEWRYPKTEFENLLSVAWSKEAGRHYK